MAVSGTIIFTVSLVVWPVSAVMTLRTIDGRYEENGFPDRVLGGDGGRLSDFHPEHNNDTLALNLGPDDDADTESGIVMSAPGSIVAGTSQDVETDAVYGTYSTSRLSLTRIFLPDQERS